LKQENAEAVFDFCKDLDNFLIANGEK